MSGELIDGATLFTHCGNPKMARVSGLTFKPMHECEGGGYYMPIDEATRVVAALNACRGVPTDSLSAGVTRDLLEALERCVEVFECSKPGGSIPPNSDAVNMARAALAKARGDK